MTETLRAGHYLSRELASQPAVQDDAHDVSATTSHAHTIETLYAAHFDFVWRSLKHMGLLDAVIDDAVQDTFVVAHRRLSDFAERSSPRTWLFGIALRVARDYRRSRSRRERLLEAFGWRPEPKVQTPYDHTVRAEASRVLRNFLQALPEEQRAVFVLADVEQMTAPEIAETLGVKLNTVYSRLRVSRIAFNALVATTHADAHEPSTGRRTGRVVKRNG